MLFRFFLCFLWLQTGSAQAQEKIWVKAYNSSFEDFSVFLAIGSRKSYAEYQLETLREQAESFELKEKLIEAQKLYLEGKHQKAMKFFNQITGKAYKADWSKEHHRIIIYAFLRSAQIQEDKTEAFLISVRNFNGQSLQNYKDFDLFSPPLINELKRVQTQSSVLYPDWKALFPHHEIVLVNGQKVDKNQSLPFFATTYRITALSSSHRAWSQKISLSQLVLNPIQTERLSTGFCENIKLLPELEEAQVQLFSKPHSKCRVSEAGFLEEFNRKDLKEDSAFKQRIKTQILKKDSSQEEKEKESRLPTWLMVGAGIVTLSVLISLGANKESEEEFVH